MNEKEALQTIISVITEIKQTDDDIISVADNLKIILLNLKIENARIHENTGILPITDALNESVEKINSSVKKLVTNNRKKTVEALEVLSKYIGGE